MPPTTTSTTAAVFSLGAISFFSSSARESRVCKHPRKVPLSHSFVLPRAGNDITASKEGPFVQYLYKAAHHWQAVSQPLRQNGSLCLPLWHRSRKGIVTSVAAGRRSRRLSVLLPTPCWRFPTFQCARTQREYNPPKFNIEIVSSSSEKKEKSGFVSR